MWEDGGNAWVGRNEERQAVGYVAGVGLRVEIAIFFSFENPVE